MGGTPKPIKYLQRRFLLTPWWWREAARNYQMVEAGGLSGWNINWQIDPFFPRLIPLTLAGPREAPVRSQSSSERSFIPALWPPVTSTAPQHTDFNHLVTFTQEQDGSLRISHEKRFEPPHWKDQHVSILTHLTSWKEQLSQQFSLYL